MFLFFLIMQWKQVCKNKIGLDSFGQQTENLFAISCQFISISKPVKTHMRKIPFLL